MEKLIDPRLQVAISGFNPGTTLNLSWGVIVIVPPVVGTKITLVLDLIRLAMRRYVSGSEEGCPVRGSRAWTWIEAAPAAAHLAASSAICSGVMGKLGVWVGKVMLPFKAAVTISLSITTSLWTGLSASPFKLLVSCFLFFLPLQK